MASAPSTTHDTQHAANACEDKDYSVASDDVATMSAGTESDNHMITSPNDSDMETAAADPPSALLSPPDSQHRERIMPTSASSSAVANSNGKRPLQTISNGNDDMDEIAAMANGKARQDSSPKTHGPSGYQWSRVEDEPGYSWLNKKAIDEYNRAWDSLQHREHMVKNRYGDPFEVAEKERAVLASIKQG